MRPTSACGATFRLLDWRTMAVDPALIELIERTAEATRRHVDVSLGVLRGEMSGLGDGLRGEMAVMRDGLRGEMSALRDDLRGEIGEVKRHAEVIAEDLRDRIQLVAEGLMATNERLDRRIDGLRSEMKEEFADVRAMIRVSYRDLDQRVTRLESGAG